MNAKPRPDYWEGHRVIKTDERLSVIGTRVFRWRAEALAQEHSPIPSYHLRIERKGMFTWNVVAYQNRLEPEGIRAHQLGCRGH